MLGIQMAKKFGVKPTHEPILLVQVRTLKSQACFAVSVVPHHRAFGGHHAGDVGYGKNEFQSFSQIQHAGNIHGHAVAADIHRVAL